MINAKTVLTTNLRRSLSFQRKLGVPAARLVEEAEVALLRVEEALVVDLLVGVVPAVGGNLLKNMIFIYIQAC